MSNESWEDFPLELYWISVGSIQIFEIASFQKPFDPVFIPFDFVLPGFDWSATHGSQTEHRIGEDVGFGIRNLKGFVA